MPWSVPAAAGEVDAFLDLLTVGVLLHGPSGELVFVNRAARELLGLAPAPEALPNWLEVRAVREDGTPFPAADHPCSTALATRRRVRGVLMGFDRPGSRRRVWALASAEPVPGEDGAPRLVVCTLQDATRQRRRESRLRESELRYRQTLDRVQEVVWRTNGAGRITYVNAAACRVLGRPASDLIGHQGLDLVRSDQRAALRQTFARLARERNGTFYDELVVSDRDGRPVRLNQQVQVLVDGGRVRGFQGVGQEAGGRRVFASVPAAEAEGAPAPSEDAAPVARILVVDDNDVNLKVTVAMLESLGYRADTAENGLEAVHACEHRAYDAVLMDCQMPQMDGFKATAFIREREGSRRHTPIVALTASVLPGERQKCLSAGMDDFLCKPVSLRQLDETLRRWTLPHEPEPESGRWVLAAEHPLRTLEMQGLGSLVAEVFGTFLETTPTYVRQMHSACARGDTAHLISLAHSLKGAAVQVGAEDMAEICARVQGSARTSGLTGVAALIVALESTFEGLRRELEPQRQRLLQAALPG